MPTPQHCPTPRELDDLELLTGGALAPVTGFNEPGLAGHARPARAEPRRASEVELVDPEGLPLARLRARRRGRGAHPRPARAVPPAPPDAGAGPRGARRRARSSRSSTPSPTTEIERLGELDTPVVLLALIGPGTPALSPVALLRASLAAAGRPARTPPSSPYRSPPTATPPSTTSSASAWSRRTPAPTRCWPSGDSDGDYPADIAAIVDADQPGSRPAGAGALLHRPVRQREVDGRPGA